MGETILFLGIVYCQFDRSAGGDGSGGVSGTGVAFEFCCSRLLGWSLGILSLRLGITVVGAPVLGIAGDSDVCSDIVTAALCVSIKEAE